MDYLVFEPFQKHKIPNHTDEQTDNAESFAPLQKRKVPNLQITKPAWYSGFFCTILNSGTTTPRFPMQYLPLWEGRQHALVAYFNTFLSAFQYFAGKYICFYCCFYGIFHN